MGRAYLEIESGKGEWSKVLDFGFYSQPMQRVWQVAGMYDLSQYNGQRADAVWQGLDSTLNTLRTDPGVASQLTAQEYAAFSQAEAWLRKTREYCYLHEYATMRVEVKPPIQLFAA
jgi:hypothetical protein